jgi:hypothetical protein
MDACLAIIAHEGARDTVADFMPQWVKIGLPMVGFVPAGQAWPGESNGITVHAMGPGGHNAPLLDRFQRVCRTLLRETDFDAFTIFEYDTVNLRELPAVDMGRISSAMMETYGPDVPMGHYYISLSPWIMSRPMLAAMVESMHWLTRKPKHDSWHTNLLDRWLGVAMVETCLPIANIPTAMPFPFERLKPLEWMHQRKCTIAHGFKRKLDFKDLWPN